MEIVIILFIGLIAFSIGAAQFAKAAETIAELKKRNRR